MVRVSPKKSIKKTIWTLVFGFSSILLFQNCSDLNNADVISITDVEQQLLENLPFAFESTVDQASYMSCSGQSAVTDPRSFTFKIGAYNSGSGVRLKNNYLSQLSQLSVESQHRSLALSTRNMETGAVLNVRERNNLQSYLMPPQINGEKISYDRMMFNEAIGRTFSTEHYAKRFIALGSGNYMNYVPGLPGFLNKTFEGQLRMAVSVGIEDTIRNYMTTSHYLTIAYNEAVGNQLGQPFQLVRSPHNTLSNSTASRTSVFGTGYALSFQQFDGRMPDVPNRVMNIEHAVNLENQSVLSEEWDCSEKFVIVRPEDALRNTLDPDPGTVGSTSETGLQVCPKASDAIPTNVQEQKRWERIRNILPVESWYVRLPRNILNGSGNPVINPSTGQPYVVPGCVVPKGNDFCYDMNALTGGSNNPNIRVAYYREEIGGGSMLSGWNHTVDGITYTGRCGAGTTFICPHFVTICYKK